MLTPDYLGKLPNNLIKTYEQLEEFIIDDICRRIAKTGEITSTARWQVERAREMGIYTDVLEKKIAETLDKSYEEVDKLFEDAAVKSTEADNAIYEQAKLTPIHLNTSPELQEYLLAAVKQTKGELKNIAQSLGFCVRGVNGKVRNKKLTDMYIEALDLAQFQVSSGVLDHQTAVRQAVKKIASSGVRFINYESGYSNRIDVAVRRATLTGVNQMALRMTEQTMSELGIELVEVTAHAGARPSHAEWQGQVYSFKGKHPKYANLEEATGYGRGEGLAGWNCRHSFFPYVEGSPRTYSKEQLKNLDNPPFGYKGRTYTHYEATQKQRQMETSIRKTKRELIGYNAVGDEEAFTSASIKLQRQKQEYKAFSKVAGLKAKLERTQELGYGKSISQKAVWSNKKRLKSIYLD